MYKGGRGFSLVELLIVIVVLAILAAIAIASYSGITNRSYVNRAHSEMSAISRAIELYRVDHDGTYPPDVDRNIPAAITPYMNGSVDRWPVAPWPNSVYDYDYFIGSDGQEVSQISIRFCPLGGSLSSCTFPNEPWTNDFNANSSAYWCVTGKCHAHTDKVDSNPGYCLNCDS